MFSLLPVKKLSTQMTCARAGQQPPSSGVQGARRAVCCCRHRPCAAARQDSPWTDSARSAAAAGPCTAPEGPSQASGRRQDHPCPDLGSILVQSLGQTWAVPRQAAARLVGRASSRHARTAPEGAHMVPLVHQVRAQMAAHEARPAGDQHPVVLYAGLGLDDRPLVPVGHPVGAGHAAGRPSAPRARVQPSPRASPFAPEDSRAGAAGFCQALAWRS